MKATHIAWIVLAILIAGPLAAHIGSPDVFFQGDAGPYHLVVSIRTPQMIPGIAEIQIRSSTPGVKQIKIVPLYIVGEGSKYPPPPDVLLPSKDDPQFFSGKLWLMASGSWQVRVEADGDAGSGTIAVPVPAAARSTMPMQKSLGALLAGLMVLLVAGIVSIIGAARREGQLEPGQQAGPAQKRAARFVMAGAFLVVAAVLVGGAFWWKTAAANLSNRMIYTAPDLFVSLVPGDQMLLRIGDSKWHTRRPETVATPLMPDHGHLMHLFLIRTPQMDRFYHLHPVPDKGGVFLDNLPPVAAGHYQVFADIVRVSGFPDTLSAQIDIPETAGKPLSGDDSTASAVPISADSQNAKDVSRRQCERNQRREAHKRRASKPDFRAAGRHANGLGTRRRPAPRQSIALVQISTRGRKRQTGRKPRALHGNGRPRRIRPLRLERLRSRTSRRFSSDGSSRASRRDAR